MRIIAAIAVVLFTVGLADAAVMVQTEPTGNGILRATGITGLVIGSQTFDVTLNQDIYPITTCLHHMTRISLVTLQGHGWQDKL